MRVVETVAAIVAPVTERLGVELVDVEHTGPVVRVVVDEPGGIGLDRLAEVTRATSRALDEQDPLPGRYTLEVSSPGLERPLRTPRHFALAVGQQVALRTRPAFEGERRLAGVLAEAGEEGVVVRTGAGDVRVPYDEVERARTVFEWGPAPKPGKGGRTAGRRGDGAPAGAGGRPDEGSHEGQAER